MERWWARGHGFCSSRGAAVLGQGWGANTPGLLRTLRSGGPWAHLVHTLTSARRWTDRHPVHVP